MDVRQAGPAPSVYWSYARWSAENPDVTFTGSVSAASALTAQTPDFVHRVDTWQPGSVADDLGSWSQRSTWVAAAADLSRAASASALLAGPAQQFVVSPAAAALAGVTGADVADGVTVCAATVLDLDPSDVTALLRGGASLSGLAAANGVPADALVDAVRAALPDVGDPVLMTTAAQRLADHAGPLEEAPLEVPPTAGGEATQVLALTLDRTAALLRTTPADLMGRLSAGESLASLARAKGVSDGALLDAVRWDLPPQTPGWDDRLALARQIADDAASVTEVPPQPLAGQRFDIASESGPDAVTVSLDATSALLGTTTDELMARLSGGETLASVAEGAGVPSSDLLDAVLTDLPAATPGWNDAAALAEQVVGSASSTTVTPSVEAPVTAALSQGQEFTFDPGWGPQTVVTGLDTTAALLGTDLAGLQDQLGQGWSLAGLADAAGVAHADLVEALVADLPGSTPGWDDVYALAEQVAATTTSSPVGGGGPPVDPGLDPTLDPTLDPAAG